MLRRRLCGLAFLGLCALSGPARAHFRTSTFSDIATDGPDVTWRLRVRATDLAGPQIALRVSEPATAAGVLAQGEVVADWIDRRLAASADGVPCSRRGPVGLGEARGAPEPSVTFTVRWHCPRPPESLRLRYEAFFDLDELHQGFARVAVAGGRDTAAVFRSALREVTLTATPAAASVLRSYLALGVEHILSGWDHLAFLAGLLLAALRRPGAGSPSARTQARVWLVEILKLVTAFTVAHSISLALATLRPGLLPTAWVEPAIAASVAWVGLENLVRPQRRRRWLLVFAFGLVHGLGFASALEEVGLPTTGLALALVAFNLGVEAGQLAVVAAVAPLLGALASRAPDRYLRLVFRPGSAGVALAGLVWLVARLVP